MHEEFIDAGKEEFEVDKEHPHQELIDKFGATSTIQEIPGVGMPLGNCYAFVKQQYYPALPPTATLKASLQDNYSDVAVFYYHKSGLPHYAKTIKADYQANNFLVDEANYRTGKRTLRVVSFNDPNLLGFYKVK